MSEPTALGGAAVQAFAAVAGLQLLGASLAASVLRGRHLPFCLASGLLWGGAAHVLLAAAVLLPRLALGAAPLLPLGPVAALSGTAILVLAAVFHLHAGRWGVASVRVAGAQLAAAGVAGAVALLAIRFDLTPLTPDSLALIEAGLALARVSDPALVQVSFLGGRGLFGAILHAPAAASPLDFLWFLTPLFGLSTLATLVTAAAGTLIRAGERPKLALGLAGLGCLWLVSCYLWLFQLFYLHVNGLAAGYVLLFFVGAWTALAERDERWMPLAGLALLAFQMIRVEGSFFAALAVAFLVLERADDERPQAPELWLILPGVTWCAITAALVGSEGAIVDRARVLAMAGTLLACLPLGWAARRPRLRGVRGRLPLALAAALALGVALLFALAPDHMSRHLAVLLRNAGVDGRWSTAWTLVPGLLLAAPLFRRIPHQRFVSLALTACLLGLLGLTFVGYWRAGWFDSGNRMLTHALPALVWLGILRAAPTPIDDRAPS